jgi:hypothetical protein
MPRIELIMCVFAGVSGSLVGVLWSGFVTMPWLARLQPAATAALRRENSTTLFSQALLMACGGAALGFLFWLGWALAALVNAPWYAVGALFGLLAWSGIAVPLLGTTALHLQRFTGAARVLAVEWLVTCLAVGLFCALAWQRYA